MARLLRGREPDPRDRAALAQADGADPNRLGNGRPFLPVEMGLLVEGRNSRRAPGGRTRGGEAVLPRGKAGRTRRGCPRALAGERQYACDGVGSEWAPTRRAPGRRASGPKPLSRTGEGTGARAPVTRLRRRSRR